MAKLRLKLLVAVIVVALAAVVVWYGVDIAEAKIREVGTLSSTMTVEFTDGTKQVLTRSDVLHSLNIPTFGGKDIKRIHFISDFAPNKGVNVSSFGLQAAIAHEGQVVKTTAITWIKESFVDGAFFALPGGFPVPGDYIFAFIVHLETSKGKFIVAHEIGIHIKPTVVVITPTEIIDIATIIETQPGIIEVFYPGAVVVEKPFIVGDTRIGVYAV